MTDKHRPRHELRPVTASDLEWLIALRLETMGGYFAASGLDLSHEEHAARVKQDFESILIITLDGEDVGMIKVMKTPGLWMLGQIQLLPAAQGRGIGARVIKDLLTDARGASAAVVLHILKVNPAKRLYDRLGFRVVSETERSYEMRLAA